LVGIELNPGPCENCGYDHPEHPCPAEGKKCGICGGQGHFRKVCKNQGKDPVKPIDRANKKPTKQATNASSTTTTTTRSNRKKDEVNSAAAADLQKVLGENDALKKQLRETKDLMEKQMYDTVMQLAGVEHSQVVLQGALQTIRANSELQAEKRVLDKSNPFFDELAVVKFDGGGDDGVGGGGGGRGFNFGLLRNTSPLANFTTVVKLDTLPRSLWETFVPMHLRVLRPGPVLEVPLKYTKQADGEYVNTGSYRFEVPIPNVLNYFGMWDEFEEIDSVELVAVLYGGFETTGIRPWRDLDEPTRDSVIHVYQPLMRVNYRDGGHACFPVDYNQKLGSVKPKWYQPKRSVDDVRELAFFRRLKIVESPDYGYVFAPLLVSQYLLNELYSRRALLPPKLNNATTVDRFVRMAAEDSCVSAHLQVLYENNKAVLRDTLSFMVGLSLLDARTAIADF